MATPLSIALAAHDLTRDELARRAGCSSAWMTEVVGGRRRPSDDLARRIADVLGVDDVDDLFGENDETEVIIRFVRRTTSQSGVPELLEDPAVAEQIGGVLRRDAM
jgi:transcriptional regulator with XRE-family HTH domain